MKILCVIDSLGAGGAQRQMIGLAIGFKEKGHEVSFLTYHHIDFYKSILSSANISVNTIIANNYFLRFKKMRKFIRSGDFDTILSFQESANFICEISGFPRRSWRLIVGERSADPIILKSFIRRILRWFHLLADYVVANSEKNIMLVKKANPVLRKNKCKVIYNLIDLNNWHPDINYTPLKSGKFELVIVGSHNYYKNLNGLIEAINSLSKKDRAKLNVSWYGESITKPYIDNSYIESIEKIKKYHLEDIVSFYPATNAIKKVIQEADGVGLFSFFEGFPNVICEAMTCAKPVIVSNVSDIPLLLPHDTKILCDPNCTESIKKALSYLINLSENDLTRIGLSNYEIAKSKFSKEKIIQEYLTLIHT